MRILLIRYGAWGDSIIITPLIRYLKSRGHEIYLHTSETGMDILAHNPHVDKVIPYKSSSVPDDELEKYWEDLRVKFKCDVKINMCESLERAISLHPIDPVYNYTKPERRKKCDVNFYEYSFFHASEQHSDLFDDMEDVDLKPEIFPTSAEEIKISKYFEQFKDKFVILWGLSGSSLNKAYPYVDFVIADVLRENKEVVFVTVGDTLCQGLERPDERVFHRAGIWNMREAGLATKYANLVVSPDTGLIHAAGCFDTPKICIVGSNTINNVTKHFKNDFSIQADESMVPCAPCFRIIYQASTQCPIDERSFLPKCMALGIDPKVVLERIEHVIKNFGKSAVKPEVGSAHALSSM